MLNRNTERAVNNVDLSTKLFWTCARFWERDGAVIVRDGHRVDGYCWLQSITGYCRVLQGVAGYCRVLQGVAGYCRVLQSSTGDYRVVLTGNVSCRALYQPH